MTDEQKAALESVIAQYSKYGHWEAEPLKELLAAGASEGQAEPKMNCAQYREALQEAFESSGDVMYALAQIVERKTLARASAEIAALRERLNAAASLNAVYAQDIRDLRNGIAGMEKEPK